MRRALIVLALLLTHVPAHAWNAHGHRTVTYLALTRLPPDAPAWLRSAETLEAVAFQSNLCDRWRGWHASAVLAHENAPDHYLDVDQLGEFGLTLDTIPPLRYEYLRAMAISKHLHPETVAPYDAAQDPDRSKEWPGFLPHAIAEHYTKLQASFNEIRVLEKLADPARDYQLAAARQTAIYHLGLLSHFVGDAGQPLHTTRHFNGWVGENPDGYTTSNRFHSYIDGGVLELHDLSFESLRAARRDELRVSPRNPWEQILEFIRRSHARVLPLYRLEQSGELRQEAGKQFIGDCLLDSAEFLRALVLAAWESAAPTEKHLADFVRFDGLRAEALRRRGSGAAATQGAASRPSAAPIETP